MSENIENIGQTAIEHLTLKHTARELALPKSRTAIRYCANSIRATHRQEFARAEELIAQASNLVTEMANDLRDHQDIYFAGFVQDAQKEFAEATSFAALVRQQPLPSFEQLSISASAYLNGLGEAVGELRRYLLDQLRQGNFTDCETLLRYMDDIYSLLTTVDFPDAITGGLRRTTDATRGILEKTRGDLTTASIQHQLQHSLESVKQALNEGR